MKACEFIECGITFMPKNKVQRFCSPAHQVRWTYQNKSFEKDCPECGILFTARDTRQKFCSHSCSAITNNRGVRRHGVDPQNCLLCGVKLTGGRQKYCSRDHAFRYRERSTVKDWIAGLSSGSQETTGGLKAGLRKYLVEQAGEKCTRCGWGEPNPLLGRPILCIDHIDGNWKNNAVDNLVVLCYNCHTLTPTFNALNKGNGAGLRGSGNRMYPIT